MIDRRSVPDAVRHSSCRSAKPGPPETSPSWPGLTRPSIFFETFLRSSMDARVKPAHDEVFFVTAPALQRTTPLKKRRAALRPGNEGADHD
jgi:hypothetical protein